MRTRVADFCILCAVGFHSQRATGVDMTVVMAVVQHETVHNHFNQERHLYNRSNFKLNRVAALTEWRQLCSA
jgi:hypothetical protein